MLRLLLFSILLIFLTNTAQAGPSFDSEEGITQWLTYYYKNPNPETVPEAFKAISASGILDKRNTQPPMFGFLSGVFQNQPDQAEDLMHRIRMENEIHLGVVVLGMWYANFPSSKDIVYAFLDKRPELKKEFTFLYKGSPMTVKQIPLENGPWVLDALWGHFMATGSADSIRRIISALPLANKEGTENLIIGGAAKWSLTSNAFQHERVMKICRDELAKQPEEISSILKVVIHDAEEELEKGTEKKN